MSPIVRTLGWAVRLVPRRLALGLYGVRPLAQLLRSALNSLVRDGLQEVEVPVGPLAGARLVLDLKCEKYLWLGTYEPWVQEAIRRHLRPGGCAWDVGAFVGYHTLLMRRIAGPGRVIALEPDALNRARLERNLALNGAQDVVVLPVAAGARTSTATLSRVSGHPGQTRIVEGGDDCPVVALDELLQRFPWPDLVKLDVEGAEDEVLAGAPRLVREVRPVWIVEVHRATEPALDRLRAAGYRLQEIGKGVDVSRALPVGGPAHVVALP